MQVDATAGFGRDTRSVGANFRVGVDRGVYAGLGLAHLTEDPRGTNSPAGPAVSGRLGYQLNAGTRTTTQFCPVVAFERRSLEFDRPDERADLRRTDVSAGMTVGFIVPANADVHFVPFGGLSVARRTGSIAEGSDRLTLERETYTPGRFGLGVHFANTWMVTGDVMVPFGLDFADPVYALSVVLPFGRVR
jgi:hypothetical protein